MLSSQQAERSMISLILCNKWYGKNNYLYFESGFLHQTTFSVMSFSERQVDKQVNVKPACVFPKVSTLNTTHWLLL
jgi:hypothetical protein